jgi:hypothetical protein
METRIRDIEIPVSVSKIAVKENSEDERERELKEHDSGGLRVTRERCELKSKRQNTRVRK